MGPQDFCQSKSPRNFVSCGYSQSPPLTLFENPMDRFHVGFWGREIAHDNPQPLTPRAAADITVEDSCQSSIFMFSQGTSC